MCPKSVGSTGHETEASERVRHRARLPTEARTTTLHGQSGANILDNRDSDGLGLGLRLARRFRLTLGLRARSIAVGTVIILKGLVAAMLVVGLVLLRDSGDTPCSGLSLRLALAHCNRTRLIVDGGTIIVKCDVTVELMVGIVVLRDIGNTFRFGAIMMICFVAAVIVGGGLVVGRGGGYTTRGGLGLRLGSALRGSFRPGTNHRNLARSYSNLLGNVRQRSWTRCPDPSWNHLKATI